MATYRHCVWSLAIESNAMLRGRERQHNQENCNCKTRIHTRVTATATEENVRMSVTKRAHWNKVVPHTRVMQDELDKVLALRFERHQRHHALDVEAQLKHVIKVPRWVRDPVARSDVNCCARQQDGFVQHYQSL